MTQPQMFRIENLYIAPEHFKQKQARSRNGFEEKQTPKYSQTTSNQLARTNKQNDWLFRSAWYDKRNYWKKRGIASSWHCQPMDYSRKNWQVRKFKGLQKCLRKMISALQQNQDTFIGTKPRLIVMSAIANVKVVYLTK